MICPDRCTMELIGTYRGIKINEVYKCRHCTVTSYRSVEMDKEQLIAEMAVENAELRELVAAKDAELGRVRPALKFYAEGGHLNGDLVEEWESCSGEPQNLLFPPAEESWSVEDGTIAKAALASPAAEASTVPPDWAATIDRIVPDLGAEPDQSLYPAEWTLWSDRRRIRAELGKLQPAPATEPDPLTILAERQEPLGAEFARVLHDNLDHLYVTAPAAEPAIPARRTFTDLDAERVARAFWRRIQPYVAEREYGRELPYPCPVEFAAHMSTALLALDLPTPVAQSQEGEV